MKITIDIDEQEIAERVKELVSDRLAKKLQDEIIDRGDHLTYCYHTEVRKIIREVMQNNYDVLAKEAVNAASKSIENRAVKSKLLELLKEQEVNK